MSDMPRPRPPYLHFERSRHGQPRYYVRIGKGPRVRIREDYGTPQFTAAYDAAIRGEPLPDKKTIYQTNSLGWLVARYRDSQAWLALSAATRRQRENILRNVLASAGREPYTRIDRRAIKAGIERRRPNAARHFLQTMRGAFEWAVSADMASVDPTAGVKVERPKTKGHRTWTDEERERYKKRWPLGTKERVWYEVLYASGLRRGDAVVVGNQHVKNGICSLRTEKSGETIIVHFPVTAALREALDGGPTGDLTWIVGASGRPFTKESFGNEFRVACNKAGVPGSAHGVRKARATDAANHGATEAELESMFGWRRGSRTSAQYTQEADRLRLALQGAGKIDERSVNVYSRTRQSGAGARSKKRGTSNA